MSVTTKLASTFISPVVAWTVVSLPACFAFDVVAPAVARTFLTLTAGLTSTMIAIITVVGLWVAVDASLRFVARLAFDAIVDGILEVRHRAVGWNSGIEGNVKHQRGKPEEGFK